MSKGSKKIRMLAEAGHSESFHDSSLLSLAYDPVADVAVVEISTLDENRRPVVRQIKMAGILEIRIETLGSGGPPASRVPPEVYDIYEDGDDSAAQRWKKRLQALGLRRAAFHNLIFASSFLRGWGESSELEGVRVVCRKYRIERNGLQRPRGISRGRIPASPQHEKGRKGLRKRD